MELEAYALKLKGYLLIWSEDLQAQQVRIELFILAVPCPLASLMCMQGIVARNSALPQRGC